MKSTLRQAGHPQHGQRAAQGRGRRRSRGKDGIIGYLTQQAKKHTAAFLIGRVLPLQLQNRGATEPIIVEIVYAAATRTATSRSWSSTWSTNRNR